MYVRQREPRVEIQIRGKATGPPPSPADARNPQCTPSSSCSRISHLRRCRCRLGLSAIASISAVADLTAGRVVCPIPVPPNQMRHSVRFSTHRRTRGRTERVPHMAGHRGGNAASLEGRATTELERTEAGTAVVVSSTAVHDGESTIPASPKGLLTSTPYLQTGGFREFLPA